MQQFSHYVKPTNEDKVLLIVDGHASHKYLEVLEFAKANGIVLLCLPPHCTHRLQPLDVSFFGPLKIFYDQEISKWLREHPGRVVTQYQIGSLFATAYGKAATIKTATSGFGKCGLFPVNPDIFEEHEYAPSETTNYFVTSDAQIEGNAPAENQAMTEDFIPSTPEKQSSTINKPITHNPQPGTSTSTYYVPERLHSNMLVHKEIKFSSTARATPTPTTSTRASIAEISPIPVGTREKGTKRRRTTQGAANMTSTPFLEETRKKAEEKLAKERRKSARTAKQRIKFDTEDAYDEPDPFYDDNDDDDASCIYCTELYSKSRSKEVWIRCLSCKLWAHTECAGVSTKSKQFVCDVCT